MENAQIIQTDTPLTELTSDLLANLNTYDDFMRVYKQINRGENTFSWVKADLFLAMQKKLGGESLRDLAGELGHPLSTITNYIRVARGFPPNTRNYSLSFTHHFAATRVDSYNEKTGTFESNNRFAWLEKAAKEQLSTRKLESKVRLENKKKKTGTLLCAHCGEDEVARGEIQEYVIYAPDSGRAAKKFAIHAICYDTILDFIFYAKKQKKQ